MAAGTVREFRGALYIDFWVCSPREEPRQEKDDAESSADDSQAQVCGLRPTCREVEWCGAERRGGEARATPTTGQQALSPRQHLWVNVSVHLRIEVHGW